MKSKLLMCVLALYLTSSLSAQQILSTKSGQQILLKEDGTWQNVTSTSIKAETDDASDVFELPTESNIAITRTQSNDLKMLTEMLQHEEAQALVNLTTTSKDLDALRDQADQSSSASQGGKATEIAKKETANRQYRKQYDRAANYLDEIKKLSSEKSEQKLAKKISIIKANISDDYPSINKAGVNPSSKKVIPTKPRSYPTTFKTGEDRANKPTYPCEITFDGKDPVTGKSKKEVQTGLLFTYTQEKLKPYFKSDDFLICESTLTKVGKNYYLTLQIRIKSKDAYKTYGSLNVDEELKIEFIDGSKIYGTNIIPSTGDIEAYSGHTLYSGIYQLDRDDVSDLEKKLVDTIGIMWSTGYEQYDVYNVDFLMHQANCLKKG